MRGRAGEVRSKLTDTAAIVPDNDNKTPPVLLDEHRGMASQKATDARRYRSGVEADQAALRDRRDELEKILFAAPARSWPEVAERATYLLRQFAATPEAQDPRYKRMIDDVVDDMARLGLVNPERK